MDEPAPGWESLAAHARSLGVVLTEDQVAALRCYTDLLCEWNRRFNLTAVQRPHEILSKHLLDSLSCALLLDFREHQTLIDVGTGAGFPGLPLKIAYPHLKVTLLDAVQKKLRFIERVAEELGLRDVCALHARAEDAGRDPALRERFDVVTARAVARLNVLAEWTLPLARRGGFVLAMKGPGPAGELEEAAGAIELLGGGKVDVREFVLPGTDLKRSLVRIVKAAAIPAEYPRKAGSARKRPPAGSGGGL